MISKVGSASNLLHAKDLTSGADYSWNADQRFPPASVFKLVVMIELYRQAGAARLQLDQRRRLPDDISTHGSGVLKKREGTVVLSLREYCRLMMVRSDNMATDLLIRTVSLGAVNRFLETAGFKSTRVSMEIGRWHYAVVGMMDAPISRGNDERQLERMRAGQFEDHGLAYSDSLENNVCGPRDMGILLDRLYRGELASSSKTVEMLDLMRASLHKQTIAKYVRSGVPVANKYGSSRPDRPMITVNCASVPHELFESEFFGHTKGAFTGAIRDRLGRFELADGGTLFLDEVGEIPLELQGKLLRVLQEGTFERFGDERTRTVDVRIVAASNRDLKQEVEAGRFRHDLYYRLSVFPIEVAPVRERLEDLPALAAHFLEQICGRLGVPQPKLQRRHIDALQRYEWPGNVRELQNVIERAVIRAQSGDLEFDLKEGGSGQQKSVSAGKMPSAASEEILTYDELKRQERENLRFALESTY